MADPVLFMKYCGPINAECSINQHRMESVYDMRCFNCEMMFCA